jgi:hypothetical protein
VNARTLPGQIAYDMREPDYEVEMPQIDAIDKAIDYLMAAARAYRRFIPAINTGDGYVEEAMAELRKIVDTQ